MSHTCFGVLHTILTENFVSSLRMVYKTPKHVWEILVKKKIYIYIQQIYNVCLIGGFKKSTDVQCRSQWPRSLRRRSAAARLLRLWVRIPPGAWMFVCCECCVLSGRGLCDELITHPEESYRLWCVVVCDLENS